MIKFIINMLVLASVAVVVGFTATVGCKDRGSDQCAFDVYQNGIKIDVQMQYCGNDNYSYHGAYYKKQVISD